MTGVTRRLPELELEPDELAAAMVAEENLPMYHNNCRVADDAERRHLADGRSRCGPNCEADRRTPA